MWDAQLSWNPFPMAWRDIPLFTPPYPLGTLLSPSLGPKARELATEVPSVAQVLSKIFT